jgi:hypothetical protein
LGNLLAAAYPIRDGACVTTPTTTTRATTGWAETAEARKWICSMVDRLGKKRMDSKYALIARERQTDNLSAMINIPKATNNPLISWEIIEFASVFALDCAIHCLMLAGNSAHAR